MVTMTSGCSYEVRHAPDPVRFKRMTTQELRSELLVDSLFTPDAIPLVYSHIDRSICGSAVPVKGELTLQSEPRVLAAESFAERREVGVLNIGGSGHVAVDGKDYTLQHKDCLYIGRGAKSIVFFSDDAAQPAKFYLASYPAHAQHPTGVARASDAATIDLGSREQCNERTIYKYIHPEGLVSCQLMMGFTALAPGSVWNTMPAHTHPRRSEIYMYFDLGEDEMLVHLCGEPEETRHILVHEGQAVLSPSWSIHSGCGTANYSFCWSMGGENQAFTDMDGVGVTELA